MNIFKKIGAAVLAAALMATTAYADETRAEKLEEGIMASKVYDISEGTHTYQLDLEEPGSYGELAIKDDKRATYLCEISWDMNISLDATVTNTESDGSSIIHCLMPGLMPSWKLDNLTGDIKETVTENQLGDTLYKYSLGSETGAGSGSFTFDTIGRNLGNEYIPVILFAFSSDTPGSVKFTIKPYGGETQTPGDEKPTDPVEPADPTDPTVPTDPTTPTDPTEPSDPVEPTNPKNPDTGVAGIGFTVALAAIGGAVTIISRKKR